MSGRKRGEDEKDEKEAKAAPAASASVAAPEPAAPGRAPIVSQCPHCGGHIVQN